MDQYWNGVVKFRSSTLGACSRKCLVIFGLILVYLVVMDTAMYFVLQHTDTIVYSGAVSYFSPFTTISVKQLANDPISHFILQPLAEWFEDFTNFATTFTIITPNVLSITHALFAIVNFRLISSDHLFIRRCGVVLFEFVVLLDAFDGTVYRSINKTKYHFIQKRGERGYQIDLVCDIIATACLLLSIMYSQLKHRSDLYDVDIIPVVKPVNNGSTKKSRKVVLLTVFAFAGLIILSAICWDRVVVNMGTVLQTKQTNSNLESHQTDALHSFGTWIVLLSWSLLGPYSFMHMAVIAIFMDRLWEFLSVVVYVGYSGVVLMMIFSEIHYNNRSLEFPGTICEYRNIIVLTAAIVTQVVCYGLPVSLGVLHDTLLETFGELQSLTEWVTDMASGYDMAFVVAGSLLISSSVIPLPVEVKNVYCRCTSTSSKSVA